MNRLFYLVIFLISVWSGIEHPASFAAAISTGLLKAKQDAEAKRYIFITSRDEIIAKAKQEGKLEELTFLGVEPRRAMIDAFRGKYPFLQVHAEDFSGTDQYQRFIGELKAGLVKRWDTAHISNHAYFEYPPYLKKFDVLGMAEQGVLNIPLQTIDPNHRNIVAKSSVVALAAYNRNLISGEKVPGTWEGFLKPEFKGRKFAVDIRPNSIANLVPAWGLEKTVEFGKKIAAQDPIWVRGQSRVLISVATGEYALYMGANLSTTLEAQAKNPTKSLDYKILDPVPVRPSAAVAILASAPHPYAALLWLEFQASPEGQKILDKYGPADGTAFVPGTIQNTMIRGKSLSVMNYDTHENLEEWVKKIVEAYGFPVAK